MVDIHWCTILLNELAIWQDIHRVKFYLTNWLNGNIYIGVQFYLTNWLYGKICI